MAAMDTWEVEKQAYVTKLDRERRAVQQILNLDDHGLIDSAARDTLQGLSRRIQALEGKLERGELEVAIVGLEKAGKSTFANALIQNDLLPTQEARCTYTSTRIRYGEENTAEVKFFTREELERKFQCLLGEMGIAGGAYRFDTIGLEEYRRLFGELSEEKQKLYQNSCNMDVENMIGNRESLKRYLGRMPEPFREKEDWSGFITEPAKAIAVREITITSSALRDLKNAVIYDVPGFDSPTQMHIDQTIERMQKADAIILVASAYRPSLTGPQLNVFSKCSDEDGVPLRDKLFVFANQADLAKELANNMEVLRKDCVQNGVLSESKLERLLPGSACGRLERLGILPRGDCADKLDRLGIDDGIEALRTALVEYNQTERFEMLKRRANKLQNDMEACFAPLRAQYAADAPPLNLRELSQLAIDYNNRTKKTLKQRLEALRQEIRCEYREKGAALLTDKIAQRIRETVSNEAFDVQPEELEQAVRRLEGIALAVDATRVDNFLRERKAHDIYVRFASQVVELSVEEHREYREKIRRIFLDSMEIDEENPCYGELSDQIGDLIARSRHSDDVGYYQSLVERFSRDLVEVLIQYPYGGLARWNRFAEDMDNFYSLSVFYPHRRDGAPLNRQPMIYRLLFHEGQAQERAGEIRRLVEATLEKACPAELEPLVHRLVDLHEADLVSGVQRALELVDKTQPAALWPKLARGALEGYLKERESAAGLDKEEYQGYFAFSGDKTYEGVQQEIHDDIAALQELLVEAVLRAIHIEKPFVSREVRCMEDMMDWVETSEFDEFVVNHLPQILYRKYQDLDRRQAEQRLNAAILQRIEVILQEVNQ